MFNLVYTAWAMADGSLFDRDVDFRFVMSKAQALNYRDLGAEADESIAINCSRVRIQGLIKKYYHHLYYITQKDLLFSWSAIRGELFNATCQGVACGCIVFYSLSSKVIDHFNGHTPDYFIASYALYGTLIYGINLNLLFRRHTYSWQLLLAMAFTSFAPFYLMSFLYDFNFLGLNTGWELSLFDSHSSPHYYLIVILNVGMIMLIEGFRRAYRLWRSPLLSDYFKGLIAAGKSEQEKYFALSTLEAIKKQSEKVVVDKALEAGLHTQLAVGLASQRGGLAEDSRDSIPEELEQVRGQRVKEVQLGISKSRSTQEPSAPGEGGSFLEAKKDGTAEKEGRRHKRLKIGGLATIHEDPDN